MTFDPFTATLAEAMAQPDANASPAGAVARFAAAQELIARREFFERNPLDGAAICMRAALVAPDWLARAYLRGWRKVVGCRVGSLDEAFGAPFPKGKQVAAMRRRRVARVRVANVVSDLLSTHPEASLKALWAAAGATGSEVADGPIGEAARRLGVGKTEAEELYKEAVALGIVHDAAFIRQSLRHAAKRPSRPAKSTKVAGLRKKR